MEHFDRLIRLHRLLRDRHTPLHYKEACDNLGCGKSTFYRLVDQLEAVFQAPVERAPEGRGIYYDRDLGEFEFPGLWFTGEELGALALLHSLLAASEPELLAEQIEPLKARLGILLSKRGLNIEASQERMRVLRMAGRPIDPGVFRVVGRGLIERQQLNIHYYNRKRDDITQRQISPQRMLRYRDNWYLDAYCHRAKDLRSFAVECIRDAEIQEAAAKEVDEQDMEERLTSGFGIFSGKPTGTAVLLFSAERARWVATEVWHPKQQGRYLPDGRYELQLPYSDSRELLMDVLRHGTHVEVQKPMSLRSRVMNELQLALQQYQPDD